MKKFAAVILMCLAGAASAQDFPALYNVTGVADDNELKMRTRPTEEGTVIGSMAFDAKNVEVIEEKKGWGRVNHDGLSGWVPLEPMERQAPTGLMAPTVLTRTLRFHLACWDAPRQTLPRSMSLRPRSWPTIQRPDKRSSSTRMTVLTR